MSPRPGRGFEVSEQQIEAFQADGAVVLRGLLSASEVELLRAGIEANLAHPSARAKVASSPEDPGRFIEDFCCWSENERYARFIRGSALGEVGAALMRSSQARLYHDHMLTKEPGTRAHALAPGPALLQHHRRAELQLLDPGGPGEPRVDAGVDRRPHRGPWLMPRSFMDAQAKWFPEGTLAELPDIDARRGEFPILGWELEPGDAVCFHMLTLHAAGGVAAGRRRRVFSVRLIGDDVRHAPRRWPTSPEFAGLAASLPAGAPLEHPLFPRLWPLRTSAGV